MRRFERELADPLAGPTTLNPFENGDPYEDAPWRFGTDQSDSGSGLAPADVGNHLGVGSAQADDRDTNPFSNLIGL